MVGFFCCLFLFSAAMAAQKQDSTGWFAVYELEVPYEEGLAETLCYEKGEAIHRFSKQLVNDYTQIKAAFCIVERNLIKNGSSQKALFFINFTTERFLLSNSWLIEDLAKELSKFPKYFDRNKNNINHYLAKGHYEVDSLEDLVFFADKPYNYNLIRDTVINSSEGFKRLVQANLSISLDKKKLVVDGVFGKGSKRALNEKYQSLESKPISGADVLEFLFRDTIRVRSKASYDEPNPATASNDPAPANESFDDEKPQMDAWWYNYLERSANLGEDNNLVTEEDLLEELEELKSEYEELKTENSNLIAQNQGLENRVDKMLSTQEIFESGKIIDIAEILYREQPKQIVGINDGTAVKINVQNKEYGDPGSCRINFGLSIREALKLSLENPNCFKIVLEEYEEDTLAARFYDGNRLTIPVLEKQNDYIVSINSEIITSLPMSEQISSNCYVGVMFYKNKNPIQVGGKNFVLDLFIKEKTFTFSDYKFLIKNEFNNLFKWQDVKLKFVNLANTSEKNRDQMCQIEDHDPIKIYAKKNKPEVAESKYAIVERDGSVILNYTPVKQIEGRTLVVFMDEFVGLSKNDTDFGFHEAIKVPESGDAQVEYYSGFLNGVKKFAEESSYFTELFVYSSAFPGDTRDSYKILHNSGTDESELIKFDKFTSDYMTSFEPGMVGDGYDDKKRFIINLKKEYQNLQFISFGPSGLSARQVCIKGPRISNDVTIFDIWPDDVILELDKDNKLITIEKFVLYECENLNRVFGFQTSNVTPQDKISNLVAMKLKDIFGVGK